MVGRPTILVVRFSSLGDVVLTTPLLRALRRAHPDASITFVTKAAYRPLLAHNPHVARVHALRPGAAFPSFVRALRGQKWDWCLDLHGSLRARTLRLALGGRWRGYAKRRLARTLLVRFGVDRYGPPVPVAERYFEAARPLGAVPDGAPAEVFTGPADEARAAAIADAGSVVLAPGARHASKRWPRRHWRAFADLIAAEGLTAVGVGTRSERELLDGAPVTDGFGIGLGATAAVMRRARVVVANDSGLMHLATAVGTRVVALLGPTVEQFGFFPYRAPATVLQRTLPCRPCTPYGGTHCPLGHHRCMFDISPQSVAAAVTAA